MRRYLIPIILVIICGFSWFFSIKSYTSGSKEYESLIAEAEVACEKKVYEEAEEKYKKAIQKKPKSKEALFGLANTYFLMEKYDNAVSTCEKILEEEPEDFETIVLEAKSLSNGGKYSKSVEILSKVEQTDRIKDMVLEIKSKYTLKYFKVNFPKNWDINAPLTLHLSVLTENEKMAAYDSRGRKVVHGNISYLGPVSDDGELYPAIQDDIWCYVDEDGMRKMVPDKEYDFLGPFINGFAVAKRDDKFGYIDTSFNEYSFEFENAYNFYDGHACVRKDGKISIIGTDFNVVKETDYEAILADEYGYTNHFGVSVFIKDDLYYLCNSNGERISDFSAESIGLPMEKGGLVEYKQGDKYGFVDSSSGKILIEAKYDEAKAFSNGLAPVKTDEKWGFIDKDGNEIVAPTFNFATSVSDWGSAWIKNEAGYALLSFYFLSN